MCSGAVVSSPVGARYPFPPEVERHPGPAMVVAAALVPCRYVLEDVAHALAEMDVRVAVVATVKVPGSPRGCQRSKYQQCYEEADEKPSEYMQPVFAHAPSFYSRSRTAILSADAIFLRFSRCGTCSWFSACVTVEVATPARRASSRAESSCSRRWRRISVPILFFSIMPRILAHLFDSYNTPEYTALQT